jgi:hypothetical protein
MKTILTLLSVVCVASFGFAGCASSTKPCRMDKNCPMMKKACANKPVCCTTNCPMKKAAQ